MEEKNEGFSYSYSGAQQAEIKKIREKYVCKEENKMDRLRRLDKSVSKPGMTIALIIGIVSTLVMGIGMCCTMVWADSMSMFVIGIVIGLIGIGGMISAYPICSYITKRRRKKLAPEIIRLTDELIK